MTKYEKITIFISIVTLCVATFSILFSCEAKRLSQEANNLSKQSELLTRAIAATEGLQAAIQTLKGYELEGATFSDTQSEALTIAGQKSREARHLRNSGEYEQSVIVAEEGLHILELNFPVSQYPEIYYY